MEKSFLNFRYEINGCIPNSFDMSKRLTFFFQNDHSTFFRLNLNYLINNMWQCVYGEMVTDNIKKNYQ